MLKTSLLAILLISAGFWIFDSFKPAETSFSAESSLTIESQDGDFIFRKGRGIWSPLFANANPQGYSHVGVIYSLNGQRYILHSEANDYTLEGGVQMTPIGQFIRDSEYYTIKSNRMDSDSKQRFMDELLNFYRQKAQFDTDFSLDGSPNALYCTEYIWQSAKNSGILLGSPATLMGKEYITIDAIMNSPYLSANTKQLQ